MKSKKQETPVKNRRLDGYGVTSSCAYISVIPVTFTFLYEYCSLTYYMISIVVLFLLVSLILPC